MSAMSGVHTVPVREDNAGVATFTQLDIYCQWILRLLPNVFPVYSLTGFSFVGQGGHRTVTPLFFCGSSALNAYYWLVIFRECLVLRTALASVFQ